MKKSIIFRCVTSVTVLSLLISNVSSVKAASAPFVESDTTIGFTRPYNETYAFKFTDVCSSDLPKIVAGNGAVLRTENCHKVVESGNDVYYFKVRAIGQPGTASAIYTTLPGQKAVNHCVITVGESQEPVQPSQSSGTIKARYHGSTYGCKTQAEYDYVMSRVSNLRGTAQYKKNLAHYKSMGQAGYWEKHYNAAYSDTLADVYSILGSYSSKSGSTAPKYTSAYDELHDGNGCCVASAQVRIAVMHCHGYDAEIVRGINARGANHAWIQFKVDGKTYQLDSNFCGEGTLKGYKVHTIQYN